MMEGDEELNELLGREATGREVTVLGFMGFALEAAAEGSDTRAGTMIAMLIDGLGVSQAEIDQALVDLKKVVDKGWGPVPAGTEFIMARQNDIDQAGGDEAYVAKVVPGKVKINKIKPLTGKHKTSPEAEAKMERLVSDLSDYKMGVLGLLTISFKMHEEGEETDSSIIAQCIKNLGFPMETIKEVGEILRQVLKRKGQ
jgi:hypothetical protein